MQSKIHYFPGHMQTAKREIRENLKKLDLIIHVVDSRVPISSFNEELIEIINNKPLIICFNKNDLANVTNEQKEFYKGIATSFMYSNAKGASFKNNFLKQLRDAAEELNIDKYQIKFAIIGMPNVGKSQIIASLTTRNKVKVENRAGVTKKLQYINVTDKLIMLDTPGVFVKQIEDEGRGLKLALSQIVNEKLIEEEDLAVYLIQYFLRNDKTFLEKRYNIEIEDDVEVVKVYDIIAKVKNIYKNKEPDYDKISTILINDFRKQRFGKINLDEEK